MTKRSVIPIIFLVLIIISSCALSQDRLTVESPKDESTTGSDRITVKGSDNYAKSISINSIKIPIADKKFEAVAILRPGKNLIKVTGIYNGKEKIVKDIRVLKIIDFDDLGQMFGLRNHWAKKQIVTLATLGIIEGYSDNTFKPEQTITRGEFATWLARVKQLKTHKPVKDVYFDVPKEHWRAPFIKAVSDAGYMKAETANNFGIDSTIKRAEAISIIARAYNLPVSPISGQMPFSDIDKNTKNIKYILAAYKSGIIEGTSRWKRSFDPERDMKRSETVILFSRLPNTKWRQKSLHDFSQGYNAAFRLCKISTNPVIKKLSVTPNEIFNDGNTSAKIVMSVYDAQGSSDISLAWADLADLGGPINAKMELTKLGSFEIIFTVSSEVKTGQKKVKVFVQDKSGLKAQSNIDLNVKGK